MTRKERIAKVKEELKEIFGKQTFIDGSAFIEEAGWFYNLEGTQWTEAEKKAGYEIIYALFDD